MKYLFTYFSLLILSNNQAQTYDVHLFGNLELPTFFNIYDDENILITNNGEDTVFSGYLGFNSNIQGSVTFKPEEGYQIKITASNTGAVGSGTHVGGRPPGSGTGGLSKIDIFPNPAKNLIQLQSTENIVEYSIYDSFGNIKSQNKLLQSKQFSININNLNPGIYYLTALLDNGQTISKQFIKQ